VGVSHSVVGFAAVQNNRGGWGCPNSALRGAEGPGAVLSLPGAPIRLGAGGVQERGLKRGPGGAGLRGSMAWVSVLSCLADERCALPAKPTSC